MKLTNRLTLSASLFFMFAPVAPVFAQDKPVAENIAKVEPAAVVTVAVDAPAADAPSANPVVDKVDSDPVAAASDLVGAIKEGNWKMVAALALAFVMMALSKVRDKIKLFSGDRGGAILVMFLSLMGALSTSLAAGVAVDWRLFVAAVGTAWMAVGGYSWLKRLVNPGKDDATTRLATADLEPVAGTIGGE